jgi:hypothetical protein
VYQFENGFLFESWGCIGKLISAFCVFVDFSPRGALPPPPSNLPEFFLQGHSLPGGIRWLCLPVCIPSMSNHWSFSINQFPYSASGLKNDHNANLLQLPAKSMGKKMIFSVFSQGIFQECLQVYHVLSVHFSNSCYSKNRDDRTPDNRHFKAEKRCFFRHDST